ncbi:MAG: thioredoxin family protein [Dokdonella sp.]
MTTDVGTFFDQFTMLEISDDSLEDVLSASSADIDILFLWGRDCRNCDVAKRTILAGPSCFQWPKVRWLHGNVYAEPALGTRFGLHGIPAFIVFSRGRKLGRISPFPGTEPFIAAINRQIEKLAD